MPFMSNGNRWRKTTMTGTWSNGILPTIEWVVGAEAGLNYQLPSLVGSSITLLLYVLFLYLVVNNARYVTLCSRSRHFASPIALRHE